MAFLVCVFFAFLAFCCAGWKRGVEAVGFPAGSALVGPWCGWGAVLRILALLLSAGAAAYYTWVLADILGSQRYSLSDLKLEGLTAFIFAENQKDAFVHSSKTPSAFVHYSFSTNALDLQISELSGPGGVGSPEWAKLFLDLSGAQFGRVRDLVELDLDLATAKRLNAVCAISANGRSSRSAGPEPALEAVDVQIYRDPGYLTEKGAFDVSCTWTSSISSSPIIHVEF